MPQEWIDPRTGRWNWSVGRIVWIDVETTGIWIPEAPPLILEVAAVVTDRDLNVLGEWASPLLYEEREWSAARPHEAAVSMHQKTGLWDLVDPANNHPDRVRLADAEASLCQLLEATSVKLGPEKDTRPVLWGGASPAALDRPIMRLNMPRFYGMIHYRTLDISCLRLAAINWGGDFDRGDFEASHRALEDCYQSIDFARRERAFRLQKNAETGPVVAAR